MSVLRVHRNSLIACGVAVVLLIGLWVSRNAMVDNPLERLDRTEEQGRFVYEGTWHFPRGGPYILGFDSPRGSARLFIDGRPVAQGKGTKTQRLVYQAGDYAVRFETPGAARLLWHPPGRRGPLEYVPPSSLASGPPEDASFGSWAGTSPIDGVIAVLMILIVAGLIAFLLRDAIRRVDKTVALWILAVFVVAFGIRLIGLGDAGQTWDEDVNWSAGRNYVTNFMSFDWRQESWTWNYQHPPVMKYVAGVGAQFGDGYNPARALSALMVAISCALLVPIGTRLFSLRAGVLAGGIASLTPHLVAHGKVVGHEAPTVLLWTIAILLCLRAHDNIEDDDRWRLPLRMVVIGIVLGLAIWSRFVNVLLAPLIGSILLIGAPEGRRLKTVWMGLAIIPAMAVLVGVMIWPRLWTEPITHMQQAWDKLKVPHSPEPFLGKITNEPPLYYFFVYLYATAPLGIVLGCLAWISRTGRRLGTEYKQALILLAWLLAPMIVLLSPVRQDGVRYIMPCLVALAVIAAGGIDFVAELVEQRKPGLGRRAFIGLGAVFGLYLAVVCFRVHPYYLDYYGEQVGGPADVAKHKKFEMGWWGEGLNEALAYVNEHADPGDRVHKQCVLPGHLAWMRGDLWATEVRNPASARWIIWYAPTAQHCNIPPMSVLVYEVTVQGAPLARVYERPVTDPKKPTP